MADEELAWAFAAMGERPGHAWRPKRESIKTECAVTTAFQLRPCPVPAFVRRTNRHMTPEPVRKELPMPLGTLAPDNTVPPGALL